MADIAGGVERRGGRTRGNGGDPWRGRNRKDPFGRGTLYLGRTPGRCGRANALLRGRGAPRLCAGSAVAAVSVGAEEDFCSRRHLAAGGDANRSGIAARTSYGVWSGL